MTDNSKKIGRWQGAGLLATTLLGTSVFILPQMTIATAGFGAMYAWLLLTLAIIPLALVFGRLSAVFPHAAGPAYFVEKAFGPVYGRTIGLIFLLVVPLGAPAALLMTYQFINELIALSPIIQLLTQLGLLLIIFLLNYRGIHISAKLQFLLTFAIITVVLFLFGSISSSSTSTISLSAPPLELSPVMAAASIAFWSFLGVEAMSHLSADFKNPKKDLIPAMMIGTVLVGVIYLISTLLLLIAPVGEGLAMVSVFDHVFKGFGAEVIGTLGVAGGLATVNVYTASIARLTWSFSNDGVLPRYFTKLNSHGVPLRALSTLLIIMALVLMLTFATKTNLEDLIGWSNGVFIIIYFASMLAAVKLLDRNNLPLIILGCIFCLMLSWGLGWRMIYACILIVITAPLLYWQHSYQNTRQVLSQ